MHPALSVIFFTTLSGAGLGLLFLHGVLLTVFPHSLGTAARTPVMLVGVVLLISGLTASLLHLGRPERAWRALSQWRSSWLSREGVAALATVMSAIGLLVAQWRGAPPSILGMFGALLAVLAVVTTWCTARIYTSLPTIAAWHNDWVLPNFMALALATGALWLWVLVPRDPATTLLAWAAPAIAAIFLLGLLAKLRYWHVVDRMLPQSTLESATGLGSIGKVSPFEAPHTETNYLLREMGFVVARRHAQLLRKAALLLGYGIPLAAAVGVALTDRNERWMAGVALMICAIGVFVERWLFFAEAKHVVTLYYRGASTA